MRYPVSNEPQHGVEDYQDHKETDELPVAEDIFLEQLNQGTDRKGDNSYRFYVSHNRKLIITVSCNKMSIYSISDLIVTLDGRMDTI